jgi:hypothetical protein
MRFLPLILVMLIISGCAPSRIGGVRAQVSRSSLPLNGPYASDEEMRDLLSDGDEYFSRNEYNDAILVYTKVVTCADGRRQKSILTEASSQLARMYGIQGKFVEGRPWLAKAKQVAAPEEPLGWSRYLGVRGRYEWQDEKDNAKAKATFIEMYEYCKKHQLHSRALDAAHMVAIVGTPEDQVTWALNAIAQAEKSGEDGWLGPLWNNLGWTYEERGEYPKMLEALIKAREYHYKAGNEHTQLVADFGVARAYWRNNDNTKAREWTDDAFKRAKERHEADPEDTEKGEWVGWGHIYLADILDSEGKKAEALEQYRAGRPYLVKAGIESWWPEQLQKLDDKIAKLEADD